MSLALYCWDEPADALRFLPFSESRPLSELRHGAWLLRQRCESALGTRAAGLLAASHLSRFVEPEAPPVVSAAPGPCLVMRSTFVPEPAVKLDSRGPARLTDEAGQTVGAVVPEGAVWSGPDDGAEWPARQLRGQLLSGVWQIIADLPVRLREDLELLRGRRTAGVVPRGTAVLGDPGLVVAEEALVEPHVVFDVRGGPIVLEAGAEVRAFTRLQGPLYVGERTRIVGGQVRESSLGPRCVVHGEVSNSVFLGYANKAHEGFVGHSVVGRWVNLGAGTITSNLKNTYGPVRLSLGGARVETGMTFLGALVGDHVKTAIGTMLPTGCVLGTGANLFGNRRPESPVPPFAWGTEEPGRLMACRMFLQTAARVLPRREVEMDEGVRAWLTDVWRHATSRECD